jgi:hypothetical protein
MCFFASIIFQPLTIVLVTPMQREGMWNRIISYDRLHERIDFSSSLFSTIPTRDKSRTQKIRQLGPQETISVGEG